MNLFESMDGSVVLYSKGVYVESSLHTLKGDVYARHSRGFIRLKDNQSTSAPGVFWSAINTPRSYAFRLGNMILNESHLVPTKKKSTIKLL